MMVLGVSLLQFLLVTLVASQAMPGCQDKCGNFSIPYPFGIGEGCFREGFDLDCNRTEDGQFLPYLGGTDIYSRYMSFSAGEMGVTQYIAQHCYNKSDHTRTGYSLWGGPYTFSSTQNTFTVLGCDTDATIRKRGNLTEFLTGCYSVCENPNMVSNGSCNGIGCCQTSIPKGLKDFVIQIDSYNNYSGVIGFSPCSYAFLADRNWFTFHGLSDFSGEFYDKHNGEAPLVLEWAIGNQTCEEAQRAPNSDYACVSKNSYCYDSNNAPGYRCNCSSGYEGNPYLEGGCQDIDECKDKVVFPCSGICTNKQGSYNCECPKGKHSVDPKVYECKSQFPIVPVAVGIGIPLLLILIGSWIYLGIQTRELNVLKEKYYQKNGGKHLEQLLAANPNVAFKIFNKEELLMATDKFDEKNILGQGGQGMVFKGVL
ncbi:Wall-associated receptor kinase 2 [Acorus calamus]|uniref:Wall-associated receptor kinase 2 n=1 Tax=Acorus calamus TaxID=4465 RepID=A0AAV9ENL3_ACOCL|nr:Wall-associated receptor kinase 2 [Acorus calamus]